LAELTLNTKCEVSGVENSDHVSFSKPGSKRLVDQTTRKSHKCINKNEQEQSNEYEKWLKMMQLKDRSIQRVAAILQNKEPQSGADDEADVRRNYKIMNEQVFRKSGERLLWLVPKKIRWRITKSCEEKFEHHGVEKVIDLMKAKFWLKNCKYCPKTKVLEAEHNVQIDGERGSKFDRGRSIGAGRPSYHEYNSCRLG
jgi:hypothetical protein